MAADPFADRVVLITGASRGIGLALARHLAARGARLILTSRARGDLEAVRDELAEPASVTVLEADLAQPGAAERLARAALAVHGRVDVLVNNAGVGYFALIEEATEEGIRRLFEVNTFAPLALARALVGRMREIGEGRIVNIVSALGRAPVPTVGVYGASKTALAVFGNVLRLELEPSGIVVVNVYPGTVDTDFERHAEREAGRIGLNPGGVGRSADDVAEEILAAAAGDGGEVWLEPEGRRMAARAILEPDLVDRQLAPLRDRLLHEGAGTKPADQRIWARWRLEASRPCSLRCERCPTRRPAVSAADDDAHMKDAVWERLRPYLGEVAEIAFCGGGDPLVHPRLADWIGEARAAGARAGFRTNGSRLDDGTVDRLLRARTDWVELTLGGARGETYHATRPGFDFEAFRENVQRLTTRRRGKTPDVSFRYVIVRNAEPELEEVIRLADALDVDRVSFTHCDVVREMDTDRPSIFPRSADPQVRALEKELRRARKVARKLRIETHATSFVPEEQAVCTFDPRRQLFIRHDGTVAACTNLAIGGKTCFLGTTVSMDTDPYGNVGGADLLELWRGETCRAYRDTFDARVRAEEEVTSLVTYQRSLRRLEETLEAAREAMPPAPPRCRTCRFLFNL